MTKPPFQPSFSHDLRIYPKMWHFSAFPNDKLRVMRALELNLITGKPVAELTSNELCPEYAPRGVIFIDRPRSELHDRIASRAKCMLEKGLLGEVRGLLKQGCPVNAKPMQSIGYKQVCDYFSNNIKSMVPPAKI